MSKEKKTRSSLSSRSAKLLREVWNLKKVSNPCGQSKITKVFFIREHLTIYKLGYLLDALELKGS